MTVSSSTIKNSYSGDGSTTAFAYGFKIFAAADLTVIIRSSTGVETVKTLTTHYDVSNVGVDGGGNVTFGSAPASGETVVIIRSTANTQTLDLVENDPFLSNSFEESLDKITHQLIEQQEEIDRSFKVSRTNSITTSEFADDATSRASKTLGFDSDGNLTTVADFLPIGGDAAQFTYSTTTTDSDPGSGVVRFNNANLASATIAYIDDLEANGTDVSAWVQSFDNVVGNDTNRGRIRISKANSLVVWAVYKVTGAVVDASGYTKVNLVYIDSAGTLANNDKVFISFVSSGEDGAIPGYYYKFDTGTSDADPGAGEIAFNNGTYASATAIYIDDSDANGVTTSTDVLTWDDSTSSIKGSLMIYDINDRSTYARFNITGSSTDASGYNKLAVTHVASNNTFSAADELSVHFSRSGNKGDTGTTGNTGDTGSTGSTGASGTNSQLAMTFSNSTSDADPGAGKIAFNNGTLSSVSVLFVDDADDASADISGFVQSWDDVSNATARGIVTVTKEGTPATYATFKVSGAVTDASGYTKIPVTHVVSNGSFSNTDGVGVHFSYSGADGSGDIEGVTAGTNLSGGGTSGTVTVNLADSAADTKGAVIVAGNAPASIGYSSGTATISIADSGASTKGAVIVAGTSPVSVGYSSGTATVAVSDASTSAKGIASFASADFAVSSGAVTLEAAVPKTDETNAYTAPQRNALTVDNDGSFDLNATNNFKCTPSGNFTLTFTNIPDGQSGFILLINSGGHTVSLHTNTKGSATTAATLTTAGTYLVSYLSDGTNVYLTNSVVYA